MGCMGIGLAAAGFAVTLKCDVSMPMLSLASQFPGEVMHADITSPDFMSNLAQKNQRAGTLAAGVACQPYSKLGDQAHQNDPRAMTLPKALETTYLGRFVIAILECVSEAETCSWVQQTLQQFTMKTKYRVSQTTLHLHLTWPARRSRWWCIVVHPMLLPTSIAPMPTVAPRVMVLHLLDHFKVCDEQTLKQLALDSQELNQFDAFGFENNTIPWRGTCATALHSCGVQLIPCPCGCRNQGFSYSRIQKGGLHGLLIALPDQVQHGSNVYQQHRHVHPDELALINGMLPGIDCQGNLRLGLCGLGQMASPLQAVWVGSHAMQSLSRAGLLPLDLDTTPETALAKYMGKVLDSRDEVFGIPQNINAVAFTHMVRSQKFAMEPITNFCPQPPSCQEPAVDDCTREPATSATGDIASPDPAGGVEGFATLRKRKTPTVEDHAREPRRSQEASHPPQLSFADQLLQVTERATETAFAKAVEAMDPPEAVETSPTAPEPRRDPDRTERVPPAEDQIMNHQLHDQPGQASEALAAEASSPTDTHVTCRIMTAFAPEPTVVQCMPGTTIGMITVAEERLGNMVQPIAPTTVMGQTLPLQEEVSQNQLICLHAMTTPDTRCPHCNTMYDVPEIPSTISRMEALFHQQSWVADDEMDYYLNTTAHLPHVIPAPVHICPEQQDLSVFVTMWVEDVHHLLGPGDTIITATIWEHHWIPLAFSQDQHNTTITTTPEGSMFGELFCKAFRAKGNTTELVKLPLMHSFAGDCGFQSFAWLVAVAQGEDREVLTSHRASEWRDLFRQFLAKEDKQHVPANIHVGGAMPDPQCQQQLAELLTQHGVWESRAMDRAQAALQSIGSHTVRNILKGSQNKWADLKAAANQAKPPMRLIMQDELQKQIQARSQQKKHFGKRPANRKQPSQPAQEVLIRASDIVVPEGVFKQSNGMQVGPVTTQGIGPSAVARATLPVSLWDAHRRLKQERTDQRSFSRDLHTMLVHIGQRALQARTVVQEVAPEGLPSTVTPLECDAGLRALARSAPDQVPRQYHCEDLEAVLQWVTTLDQATRPAVWVSFHQLLYIFQHDTGKVGPLPTAKRRGLTWTTGQADDSYHHGGQVQGLSKFLTGLCKHNGVDLTIEQRRPPSHILTFWCGCIVARVSNAQLEAADRHYREHTTKFPVRLVRDLSNVPPSIS
eukprot:Skav211393  [mRNA]  locus=scaffold1467:27738:37043:- [translate_table: standard]